MEKNSVIIAKIISFFNVLNIFYEYSITYKIFKKIGNICLKSFTIGNLYKGLTIPPHNNYAEGSLLIRFIFKIFIIIFNLFKSLYLFLAKLNLKSMNKYVFDKAVSPLTTLEKGVPALFSVMFGFFFIRIFASLILGLGSTAIIINFILCVIFLILTFINFSLLIKIIKGCMPSKILVWLYKE